MQVAHASRRIDDETSSLLRIELRRRWFALLANWSSDVRQQPPASVASLSANSVLLTESACTTLAALYATIDTDDCNTNYNGDSDASKSSLQYRCHWLLKPIEWHCQQQQQQQRQQQNQQEIIVDNDDETSTTTATTTGLDIALLRSVLAAVAIAMQCNALNSVVQQQPFSFILPLLRLYCIDSSLFVEHRTDSSSNNNNNNNSVDDDNNRSCLLQLESIFESFSSILVRHLVTTSKQPSPPPSTTATTTTTSTTTSSSSSVEDDVVNDVIEELEASGHAMKLLWPHLFVPLLTHRASSVTRQAVWMRVVPLARRNPSVRVTSSPFYDNAALLAACRSVRNDDFALIDAIAATLPDLQNEYSNNDELEQFFLKIAE